MTKKSKVFLTIIALAVLILGAIVLISAKNNLLNQFRTDEPLQTLESDDYWKEKEIQTGKLPVKEGNNKVVPKNVLLDIPFTSQAPFGNWEDQRQQDACEEASSLMVMYWLSGNILTRENAEIEILAITDYEEKKYDNFHDTSAMDTMEKIIKKYFNYDSVELRENISLEDIKQELFKGNAIIIPMNGQKLKNPYYTAPGPERHMLVARGYDVNKKEFITNDPGTKRGEKYRYSENLFYNAIRDYPTGDHVPITEVKKNMIVIKPK